MEDENEKKSYSLMDIANDIQNILAKYHISVLDMTKVLEECLETIESRTFVNSIKEERKNHEYRR